MLGFNYDSIILYGITKIGSIKKDAIGLMGDESPFSANASERKISHIEGIVNNNLIDFEQVYSEIYSELEASLDAFSRQDELQ